jgi:signal peptidase I
MWRRLVLREAVHLFLILAAVSLLHHTVGAFEVEGASMEPTLHSRQFVVVDTLLPRARSVQRGEVIVFRYPRNPNVEYVKRVVGLPGEVLAVAHGRVWIDGNPLQEAYVRDLPRYVWGPGRVPQGSVFVLGDNRNSSSDSHLWGPVPLSHVVGRAIFAWGPPVRWSWLGGQTPRVETLAAVEAAPTGGTGGTGGGAPPPAPAG